MTSIACFYVAAYLVAAVVAVAIIHPVVRFPRWVGGVAAVTLASAAGFAIAGIVRL